MTSKLTIHDVNFAGLFAGSLFGPFSAPSPDAVREVLAQLAWRDPNHPVFCRPRIGRFGHGRWVPVSAAERDRRCAQMITKLEPCGAGPADVDAAHSAATKPIESDVLIEYGLGERHVATRRSHLLGDGTTASLLPNLLTAAITGQPLADLRAVSTSFPLTHALAHHFGRHPGFILDTIREPRPRAREPAVAPAGSPPSTFDAVGRTASSGAMHALRDWRAANEPEVSIGNVIAAALRRAFDASNIGFMSPGFRMLVDGRRYLPTSAPVEGNFATAVYVEPADARSPRAIHEVIQRNLRIGRPLAAMLVSSGKNVAQGPKRSTQAGLGPPATLTISNLGPRPQLEALPMHDGCEYRAVARPEPGGVTVLLAQLQDRLTVSATFEQSVVDRAAVLRAVELVTDDPVSLLR